RGLWISGTDAKGKTDYWILDGKMPIGLVIGSEGKGMSRIIGEKCDFLITLPMIVKVPYLMSSVDASLLLYEVYRKCHDIGKYKMNDILIV
ncbi:TrmH family RNA methyltransferase, partial [Bacillus nitratireducens]|uniref:TrmH family RNA methyltransferase n=1 Tax=Bacillus nitratireducens TaxID=2026193 RepID=UPI0028489D5E|nr:RNA methyltransferase [Bacillus nitratireducens]